MTPCHEIISTADPLEEVVKSSEFLDIAAHIERYAHGIASQAYDEGRQTAVRDLMKEIGHLTNKDISLLALKIIEDWARKHGVTEWSE